MGVEVLGFAITPAVLVLGLVTGIGYGLLASGLVLAHRSTGVVNFAHGEVGAFGAALLLVAVLRWRVPYWLAFPLALGAAAAVAAAIQVAVVQRLGRAPRLVAAVATLGFAQLLPRLTSPFTDELLVGEPPQPPWVPGFGVGPLEVLPAATALLALGPAAVTAVVWFLARSGPGLALRASAANPGAASTVGISPARMSASAWAIAGGLSAVAAVLGSSGQGLGSSGTGLGSALLVRALAPAALAGMHSLPVALGAGVALGVAEQALLWNQPGAGTVELLLAACIIAALALRREVRPEPAGRENWGAIRPWPRLAHAVPRSGALRLRAAAAAAALVLCLAPVIGTNADALAGVTVVGFSIVALSVGLLAGLGGLLSLGQFALAGLGAAVAVRITGGTGNFVAGFAAAAAVSAFVALAVGAPALRRSAGALAVATLAFAAASFTWLLDQPWLLGDGRRPDRPALGPVAFSGSTSYYLLGLVLLIASLWVCSNARRSGFGRSLVAGRDNDRAARAFGVRTSARRLQALALSGALAGIGGAYYGHGLSHVSVSAFSPLRSIDLVAMVAVGGLGALLGPVVGALYVAGLPLLVDLDRVGLAASAVGWLVLFLYLPSGLTGALRPVRDVVVRRLAGAEAPAPATATVARLVALPRRPPTAGAVTAVPLLAVTGLTKRFGGVTAVEGVSFQVAVGEIVILAGPNGAGKTTVFDVVSGFVPPDDGAVALAGRDLSGLPAERRSRLGLVRSFQDPVLFPTLSVLDVVRLSAERGDPTRLLPALAGGWRRERRIDQQARDLVAMFGLDAHRSQPVSELSTGTRRLTELACIVGLDAKLALLDEPLAGVALAEREGLAALLLQLRDDLGTSLVVIEHEPSPVLAACDWMLVMAAGRIVASGPPAEVRRNAGGPETHDGEPGHAGIVT